MFNRVTAKEKSKTLLRERSFLDYLGFYFLLTPAYMAAALSIVALAVGICVFITLSALSSLARMGGVALAPIMAPTTGAIIISILVVIVFVIIAGAAALGTTNLFNIGMIRSSLRLNRGDKNVKVIDVILAGDRLGRNICITLWQGLFILLWNLPTIAVVVLIWLLAANGVITSLAGAVISIILLIIADIWSIGITINRAIAYYFSYHISEDNRDFSALDCVSASVSLTNSLIWKLFVTHLSFIAWDFLASIPFVNVFVIPYKYLTFASIYEQLTGTFKPSDRADMHWINNKPYSEETRKPTVPTIEIASGEYAGSKFNVKPGEEIIIGRDPHLANVVVSSENKAISKVHCRIRYDEATDRYVVTDHSTNGTYVNGEKLISEKSFAANRRSIVKLADGAMIIKLI